MLSKSDWRDTNERESSRYYVEVISEAYTYKKRDCNLAVPLVEALVLPFHPNNNTVAHAVCINARTMRVHYLHTNGHLSAAMFWVMNLPDSY